jgi:hypothetical protein
LEAAGARDRNRGLLKTPSGTAGVAITIQIIGKEFGVAIAPAVVKSVKEINRPMLAS